MGIFNKLFGSKKNKKPNTSSKQELRLEYNVMKNITLFKPIKYDNTNSFALVEDGVYQKLNDLEHRMSIYYELEDNQSNNQYPLEDILDKYSLYVSDFFETENFEKKRDNTFILELAGELQDIKQAKHLLGKKVFNREVLDNERVYAHLIIE